MENLKRKLRKSILYLLGFSSFPILTSCYGMPQDHDPYEPYEPEPLFEGGIVVNSDNKPIPGIKITYTVSLSREWQAHTDKNGEFSFWRSIPFGKVISLEDIDGEKNGGEFKSLEYKVEKRQETIVLELKKKPADEN